MADYISYLEDLKSQLSNLPLKTDIEKLVAWESFKVIELLCQKNFGTSTYESELFPLIKDFLATLASISYNTTNSKLQEISLQVRDIVYSGGNIDV